MIKKHSLIVDIFIVLLAIIFGFFTRPSSLTSLLPYNFRSGTDIDIIGICENGVKTTFSPGWQYQFFTKLKVDSTVEVYDPQIHPTHAFTAWITAINNNTSTLTYDIKAGAHPDVTYYKKVHPSSIRPIGLPFESGTTVLWNISPKLNKKLIPVTIINHYCRSVLWVRDESTGERIKLPVTRIRREITPCSDNDQLASEPIAAPQWNSTEYVLL